MDDLQLLEAPYPSDLLDKHGTLLFEISEGGCVTHWVAAVSAIDAVRVLRESVALEGGEPHESLSVEWCSPDRAKTQRFSDDGYHDYPDGVRDENGDATMWDEYLRDPTPRSIACSEW